MAALALLSATAGTFAQSPPSWPGLPGVMALESFEHSPFPFRGTVPGTNKSFMDVTDGARRGHTSLRGGVLWEDTTYADRHTLLFIPKRFDAKRPGTIVLYLHGNQSMLERDVVLRQRVPCQLAASGLNAVLVAPQFASDALDSSAGHFWEAATLGRFLDEAAGRLAKLAGERGDRTRFRHMPVVIVAYSGGYLPAAFSLQPGSAEGQVRGLVLLDALFGEPDRFRDWIARRHGRVFFVSAYAQASHDQNLALEADLTRHGISYGTALPTHLGGGHVVFVDSGQANHVDFVTQAWTVDPLAAVLSRIGPAKRSAHGVSPSSPASLSCAALPPPQNG